MYLKLAMLMLLSSSGLSLCSATQAHCTSTQLTNTADDRSIVFNFGKLNLSSDYLQAAGTLLASHIATPSATPFAGTNAHSVLWSCDERDLNSIYFLVATNGDDRLGGYWDLGAADGLAHVYATWWEYIGLKQTMAGVELSRFWKKVPLHSFERSNEKINIRVMDIPPLEASLYKISQLPPTTGNGSNGCNHMGSNGIYNCLRPNSYIQLSGDSHVNFSFAHDHVGEDSNTQHTFLNANNGFGYGLRNTGPLTRTETCVARNVTPLVEFPAITAAQLQQGQNIQANFNVTLECSDHVQSGTNSNQTAIAFELSNDAYITALNLGLGLENGAIKYLLSDQYQSNAELAQGVGIRLNHSISHEEMFFVRPSAGLETGGNAGWHPVLEGSSRIGRVQSGHSSYLQLYTATLEALPGKTVTPGKIKATATVVVKIQ